MNCRYLYSLDHTQLMNKRVKVAASQTIAVGDLVCIASGLLTKASSTVHTAIIGIATEAITTGATVTDEAIMVMLLNEKSVIRMVYDPGTKTSLAAADMFLTAYDIDDDQEINLDDTTGGFLLVVAYDNTNDTADVVVKASALWNA